MNQIYFKTIELVRVSYHRLGTFGVMKYEGIPFCISYECPFVINKINLSCIPEGTYLCSQGIRNGKNIYEVINVPGRSRIQIHIGNVKADTHGCILPGEKFQPIGHELAVRESAKAFAELKGIIDPDEQFLLKITSIEKP